MTIGRRFDGKSLLKRGGLAIAAATCAYFAYALARADWAALAGLNVTVVVLALAVAASAYAAVSLLLVWAWKALLAGLGAPGAGQGRVYAATQAFKYLPGNVGHIVLRHTAAKGLGASHAALGAAAALELALVAVAAACVGALAGPVLFAAAFERVPAWTLLACAAGAVLAAGLFIGALGHTHLQPHLTRLLAPLATVQAATLMRAGAVYVLFFILCGVIQFALAITLLGATWAQAPFIIGVAALAWLAGFLTPGAPAGLGVREAVLLVALGPALGPTAALALAALYRLTTVAGDLLLAALAAVTSRSTPTIAHQASLETQAP
ncbi:MAG: hypothetical protein AAF253_09505 [Pseudomonadota bacterium]